GWAVWISHNARYVVAAFFCIHLEHRLSYSASAMRTKLLLLLVSTFTVFAAQSPSAKKSAWDGAYTAAQADRGQKAYSAHCGGCHQANLGGKGELVPLRGDEFMDRWHDYSVKPLFDLIKTEMPPLRFR